MKALKHLIALVEARHGRSITKRQMHQAMTRLVSLIESIDSVHEAVVSTDVRPEDLDDVYEHSICVYVTLADDNADVSDIREVVNEFVERRGWYVNNAGFKNDTYYLTFAPHFLEHPEGADREVLNPQRYYHLTKLSILPKIMKRGIVPMKSRVGSRTYPARVYLFSNMEDVFDSYEHGGPQSSSAFIDPSPDDQSVVITIDAAKLRKGTKMQWDHVQSKSSGSTKSAYYTYTHIPRDAIISVQKIVGDCELVPIDV